MPTNKPSILRRSKPLFAPFYAAVGVTDRTVQALRDLGAKESGSGGSAGADLVNVVRGAAAVPSLAASGARSILDMGQAQYEEFSEHGEKTVRYVVSPGRLLNTRSSGQISPETAASARAARRAARQAESTVSRAGSTLRSVREEAENVVEAVTHPGPIPTRHPRAGASTEGRDTPSATRPRRPRRRPVVNDPSARSIHPSAPEDPAGSSLSSVEAAGTAMPSALKRAAKKADVAAEASSPAVTDQPEKVAVAKVAVAPEASVAVVPDQPEEAAVTKVDAAPEASVAVVPDQPEKAAVTKVDAAPKASAAVVPDQPEKAAVTKVDAAPEPSAPVVQAQPEKAAVKKASVRKTAAKKSTPRKAPATTTVAKAAAVTPTPTLPSAMEDLVEGSAFGTPPEAPTAEDAAAKAAEEAPKGPELKS